LLWKSDQVADFIGIQEAKKDSFHPSFLKNLTTPAVFSWYFLPANGTAGGILIGSRDDTMDISNVISHTFSISYILSDKNKNFSWKLLVVYGPAYEENRVEFIDELHHVMSTWQGPILVGGDLNMCRVAVDKSNRRINKKFADCFNDWVNRWGLIELDPSNRKYIWSNNQACPILAKLDRIFVSTIRQGHSLW
jgi:exonuclease III